MSFINALFARGRILSAGILCLMPGYGMAPPSRTERPTMILSLIRHEPAHGVVIGELFINGRFECFTLEDQALLFPIGIYKVTLYNSPKTKRWVPLIHIKNRKWIEIHRGNFKHNSKGCILVGNAHTATALIQSSAAFTHLIHQLSFPAVLEVT